jgi:cellulose biosynthesis protein BcsQ
LIPTVAFFNNKGGVGKTSLVYHMAWMYADLGYRVLAADLDPQANLTAAMLSESRLEELWDGSGEETLYGAIAPLMRGTGDVRLPHRESLSDNLAMLVGNLAIASFEDELAARWPDCMDGKERGFRVISAFHRCIQIAAAEMQAQVVLVDLGPNLGAINRAALVASKFVVVPVAPDLFSLQGLRNLGPTVRTWKKQWAARLEQAPAVDIDLPVEPMALAGYVVLQHSVRLDRPMQAYDRWMLRIPEIYAREALAEEPAATHPSSDAHCLGLLKRYGSLMPMAQEARKPIFHLKPADGALGTHAKAARDARRDFEQVATQISSRTWLPHDNASPRRRRH